MLRSNFSYLQRLNDERGTLKPLPRGWEQEEGGSDQRVVGKRVNEGYLAGQRTANAQVRPSREYTAFLGDDFLTWAIRSHYQHSSHLPQREKKKQLQPHRRCQEDKWAFKSFPFFFENSGHFNSAVCPPNSGLFLGDLAPRVAARPARCPQYPLQFAMRRHQPSVSIPGTN